MGVKCHACIGGTNVYIDIQTLARGTQILVGTPGRVYDMIQRGHLSKFWIKYCFRILYLNFFSFHRNQLDQNFRSG